MTLHRHPERRATKSLAFAPDGRTLATGSADSAVLLWDVTDPAQPHRLSRPLIGHTDFVMSVAFAPDGHSLATSSLDGTAIVWDVTDRAHRLDPPLISRTLATWSMAFAPDGRTLATSSIDTTLWDVTDPGPPRPLGPPLPSTTTNVPSLAFAPNSPTLATGHHDGTVTLWDFTGLNHVRDHAVERACAITHGGLDREEWDRYLPDLPYQDTCPH